MNLQFWPWALGSGTELSYLPGGGLTENISRFFTYHFISSLAWDIPRAILTATLISLGAKPILGALRRLQIQSRFTDHSELAAIALANGRAK